MCYVIREGKTIAFLHEQFLPINKSVDGALWILIL